MTDEKLYELCKTYGERALMWRRKFAGLLPEVNKRRLYEKKGFSSIFEFAAKLAGMSKEQVARVLNLELKFKDKPVLKKMLIEGKVSVNKLARIASVANVENEEFLADQIRLLPNRAVETLVKDMKFGNQNGLLKLKNEPKSVHVHTLEMLELSPEVVEKLSELQNKGIDINDLLLGFLKKREEEIAYQKAEIVAELKGMTNQTCENFAQEVVNSAGTKQKHKSASHYVPAKIKKIIYHDHGTKCSVPNCEKLATTIHHTNRFAITQIHDPRFLAPLCREHHLIAHSIDQKFHEKRML